MTQETRQVLIELLFLSLYLDEQLSLAEDELLTTALDSLGWDSPTSREQFIFAAFTKAREAGACPVKTEAYLAGRTGQVKRDGEESTSMTWLYRVLGSDGISPSEQRFLSQLEARLFP